MSSPDTESHSAAALLRDAHDCASAMPFPCRRDAWGILLVLVSMLALGWRIILLGEVLFFSDISSFFYPNYRFFSETLRQGSFPFWNPLVACGAPYSADINRAAFYPPNFLYVLAPSLRAVSLMVLSHMCLGALGAYMFARCAGASSLAAAVGGVAFGALMPSDPAMVCSGAWTGFILMGILRGVEWNNWRYLLLTSACVALSVLGGDTHTTFFQMLLAAILVLGLLFQRQPGASMWQRARPAVYAGGAVALGVALSLVQVLPALELLRHSTRPQNSYAFSAQGSVPIGALTSLLVPGIWRGWNWRGLYERPLPVSVLLVAVISAPAWIKSKIARVMALTAVAGVLLALGKYTPVYYLAWQIVPGFSFFRGAAEYFFLTQFAVAMLTAVGLTLLAKRRVGSKGMLVLGVLALMLFVAVWIAYCADFRDPWLAPRIATSAGPELAGIPLQALLSRSAFLALALLALWMTCSRRRIASCVGGPLILAVLVLEVGLGYSIVRPVARLRTVAGSIADPIRSASDECLKRRGVNRVARMGFDLVDTWGLYMKGQSSKALLNHGLKACLNCLADNENMKYGIASADGYNTFMLRGYDSFLRKSRLAEDRQSPVRCRLGRIDESWFPFLRISHAIVGLPGRNGEVQRRQPFALPSSAKELMRDETAGAVLMEFPWTTYEGLIIPADTDDDSRLPEPQEGDEVLRAEQGANHVRYLVRAPKGGILLTSDSSYPGWTVRVNGKPAEIREWRDAFRMVEVPSGESDVLFVFRPKSVQFGAVGTLTALIMIAVGAAFLRIAGKRRGSET